MQTLNEMKFSLGFNLREPKKMNGKTILYCVVRIDHKQMKLPIGVNVYSYFWDKYKQICIVNSSMSEEERLNNIQANEKIFAARQKEMEIINYICSGANISAIECENIIKEQIKEIESMANEQNLRHNVIRQKKASTILNKAFEIYYTQIKLTAKETSKEIARKYVDAFITYMEEKGIDRISTLTQKGINNYKEYLIKKGGISPKQINNKVTYIVMFINKAICVHNAFEKEWKTIKPIQYIRLEEINAKNEDKMRRPLTKEEIELLKNCKDLSPKEIEYRDLFLLECFAGYRVSDTNKLFDKNYHTYKQIKGNEYLMITPLKEENKGIKAIIWLNDEIKQILFKYENGFKYVKINEHYKRNLNENIKRIAKKANLNNMEHWINAKGKRCSDYLYNIITSHFGRYTFIYNGLFVWGFSPDELCEFSGHANDRMIREVYAIYTKEDRFNKANELIENMLNGNNKEHCNNAPIELIKKGKEEMEKELIEEYKKVLVFLGADYAEIENINDIDKLFVMSYIEYGQRFYKMGIDIYELKSIYNEKGKSLKEKQKILQDIVEEIEIKIAESK